MACANMAARLSLPVASTSRQIARNRAFSSSSCALVSSKTKKAGDSSDLKLPVESKSGATKPRALSRDPPIPETPESKSRYQQTGLAPPRRPGVKPPPTLALPSSMLPPPPRIPLPRSLSKQNISKVSEDHEKTFDIYMRSQVNTEEPTLEDLDALRPPPSTIRAAFEGVIGSGRALLPPGHSLHLAVEELGAQEATVGGGPGAKRTVTAGSRKAKKLEYQALYAATEGMITRSFTVPQLKGFEIETKREFKKGKKDRAVDLPTGKTTSKPRTIHRLMNMRWGMVHPDVVERYIHDESKIIERSYHLSPSELFIFLGRDGEDLLHLARELEMRINVDWKNLELSPPDHSGTRSGFVIRASGRLSNHEKLKKHIENQRDTVNIHIVKLPFGPALSPSLLQSISRIAGAYVENLDPKFASLHDETASSVSIIARDIRSAYAAERLVQRAAMEAAHRSQVSLFALLKDGQSSTNTEEVKDSQRGDIQFALYPFGTQGFRARSVQQISLSTAMAINAYDKDEVLILTGEEHPKAKPQASKAIVRNANGEIIDLKEYISKKNGSEGESIITATFGHLVFQTGKPTTLDPPLPDPVSSNPIVEWADNPGSTARTFFPGQVPATPVPGKVTSIHRLRYRTVEGGHIVNVDVELPASEVEPLAETTGSLEKHTENFGSEDGLELVPATQSPAGNINEETPISEPSESSQLTEKDYTDPVPQDPLSERAASPADEHPPVEEKPDVTEFTPLPVEIMVGTEIPLELMLPESTMDIYLQISHTAPMARSTVPEALDVYLDALSKFFTTDAEIQPYPPQYLNFDGRRYILVKNTSARSGISTFTDLPYECSVTSESSLDLENNIPTTFTQLAYRSEGFENGWNDFIGACQVLASQPYERSTQLRVNPT
ncbi:unnamed protein product [Rhizoctonia solani]|uniref:Uncharacterized protein n=1 Tax=Rhizoctonia solani TaxID=456999 RepID=A0A8H3A8G7_9AGAM|nr:unnamed protein product [Rhizoctonia solani]